MTSYITSEGDHIDLGFAEALDITRQLALQQQPDPRDIPLGNTHLAGLTAWQQIAIDTLEDFIVNHGEDINDRFARPVRAGQWPRALVYPEKSLNPNITSHAIRICMELAEKGVIDISAKDSTLINEAKRQHAALDLVRDFIGFYSGRLDREMQTIDTTAFFTEPQLTKSEFEKLVAQQFPHVSLRMRDRPASHNQSMEMVISGCRSLDEILHINDWGNGAGITIAYDPRPGEYGHMFFPPTPSEPTP